MSDYIKHKEYKLPNGRTVTADFNELGEARVTIEAMDYLMDMINSLVEVVRCKDCKYDHKCSHNIIRPSKGGGVIYCPLEYCSEGENNG